MIKSRQEEHVPFDPDSTLKKNPLFFLRFLDKVSIGKYFSRFLVLPVGKL
jgi:hypothetical protein